KSMSSPRKPSTFTLRYGLRTSRARCTRSSRVKNGRFVWLAAMPTTTSPRSAAARRTRSSWPRVIGSNVPGYTALIIGLPRQKMKMHVSRARASENGPAPRRFEGGVAFHVHPAPFGEKPAQQAERREAERAAAREEVEALHSGQVLAEPVEQGFPNAVRRRSQVRRTGEFDESAAPQAADDPDGVGSSPAHRRRRSRAFRDQCAAQ